MENFNEIWPKSGIFSWLHEYMKLCEYKSSRSFFDF